MRSNFQLIEHSTSIFSAHVSKKNLAQMSQVYRLERKRGLNLSPKD